MNGRPWSRQNRVKMGVGLYTFCSLPTSCTIPSRSKSNHNSFLFNPFTKSLQTHLPKPADFSMVQASKCSGVEEMETHQENSTSVIFDPHKIDPQLLQKMEYDALVWSSLHGLLVGDRNSQRSGKVPGVGMVHAPFSLLPMPFPESHWKQACQTAPVFNELVDRVSLDGKFLQDSLSKTKKVDAFTYRLLEIHSKMLDAKKIEEIRLGLHRSDYMLDDKTKLLLQIELNTISTSSFALGCLVSELHRSLLHQYKQDLPLNPERIPQNSAVTQIAEALSKAWSEYNNPRAVIMVVVQTEERNMYDQHWLCTTLKERYQVTSIKKTLAEIDALAELLPDGTLVVDGEVVAVVYFRAGYAPSDYPSEAEWRARLLMEQSSAVKCPSIAYHLVGTKKIQQELAKPNVLERFLENKDDIVNIRKCFAGLWSLEDSNIVNDAIERPGLYVMKPQREGGGNNIYGDDVRETLLRIGKEGSGESAAYILMQRIFPTLYPAILVRQGISQKDNVISEIGINSAYLRNRTRVIINQECGYLMRTKVSSVNEGGVIAGTGFLDSIYLV